MIQSQQQQFQKTYCSTIDWKSGIILLHEAVIRNARQAAVQENTLDQMRAELKALKILQFLMLNIEDAKKQQKSNSSVCGTLLSIYQYCSLHLANKNYVKVINMMKTLLNPGFP
jgi:flagellin-specific chaperone FliS